MHNLMINPMPGDGLFLYFKLLSGPVLRITRARFPKLKEARDQKMLLSITSLLPTPHIQSRPIAVYYDQNIFLCQFTKAGDNKRIAMCA